MSHIQKSKKRIRIVIEPALKDYAEQFEDGARQWLVALQAYSPRGGRPTVPRPLVKGHPAGLVCGETATPLLCLNVEEALLELQKAVKLYRESDLDIWDTQGMEIVVSSLT